jgi:hypothetical protein
MYLPLPSRYLGPKTYFSAIFQLEHTLGRSVAGKPAREATECNKLPAIICRELLQQQGVRAHHCIEQVDTNPTWPFVRVLLAALALTEFEHQGHR